ncbi:unnamed protein product [Durusdinium trenchii]|uniref:Uncharacterized protein n=1 Tax=Durusdinium trenchii TaxID=1381693 RepID=A0ABP0Q1V5_9DINO
MFFQAHTTFVVLFSAEAIVSATAPCRSRGVGFWASSLPSSFVAPLVFRTTMRLQHLAVFYMLWAIRALPGDEEIRQQLRARHGLKTFPCLVKECLKPTRQFERISPTQPGYQWEDAGGFCGSWSIQRAVMAKGAWISQQQVRNHTVAGGGHDEEVLATNIDTAFKNLKIAAEGFDYKNLPVPQVDLYRKWIKKQLVNGHALVWMIMLDGAHYPVYPGLPYGLYSHVEPVVGILSDHPLTDENFYDDDVVLHYTDADTHTYYRTMASLPGSYRNFSHCPGHDYVGYPCINQERGFGWAIQGFLDKESRPLALSIDPWQSEPDVRRGDQPSQLTGTLTASGLTTGHQYASWRKGVMLRQVGRFQHMR